MSKPAISPGTARETLSAATGGVPTALATGRFGRDEGKDLTVEVHNTGSTPVDAGGKTELDERLEEDFAPHRSATAGGVLLSDPVSRLSYQPLRVSIGHCICSATPSETHTKIEPGQTAGDTKTFSIDESCDVRGGSS